jgi:hypothetical protein
MSRISGRDFHAYIFEKRLKSLLTKDEGSNMTVLDSRLPGIFVELGIWARSPVTGQGFAIGAIVEEEAGMSLGLNHNVWSSSLAQCGPSGVLGCWVPIFGTMIVGFRTWRAQTDRNLALLGALGAIVACMAFMWGTLSLSINQQRLAILVGVSFGMTFRARDLQQTLARQYAGYLEPGQAVDDVPDLYAAGGGYGYEEHEPAGWGNAAAGY